MVNQKVEIVDHEIHMFNRVKGNVTGVLDVISFDLDEIVLDTSADRKSTRLNSSHAL